MESNSSINRLRELHGSGYEIVDGQPDIIGWTIKDNHNYRIGVVDDLLFDPEQQKVRYIIANLKNNEFDLDKRKVIVPIGIAELHETNDDVILPSIARWQLRALPTYGQRLTDYDERDIYTVFSSGSGATMTEDDKQWQKPQNFYDSPTYDHDNLFKNRRKAGQKETPIQRSLRMRQGVTGSAQETFRGKETTTGRNRTERSVYEAENAMVQNDINRNSEENTRQNLNTPNVENESVLSRIKKMHQELNEIERDLRNTRGSGTERSLE